MTDAPTLKPCPFCGGEARIDPPYRHAAICRKCSARGPVPNYSGGEAAHTWNRRALPADDAEMVERLREKMAERDIYADARTAREILRAALSAMRGEP